MQASVLQLSSVAGGQYASVVMAAKHLGQVRHFHSRIYERIVISHGSRNEFIELSSTKKNYYPPEKYYIPLDLLSLSLFTILLRTRAPKGCTVSKSKKEEESFSPISKENLANRPPPSPPKRTGIPKYHAIFNAGNVEFEN